VASGCALARVKLVVQQPLVDLMSDIDQRVPVLCGEQSPDTEVAFVESCHSRVRDELLDVEEFSCLAEARVVINDWREDYNLRRPHSALGMRTPAAFAAEWTTTSELPAAA
jgi:Integrase core domain